jgi:hypothetical protein
MSNTLFPEGLGGFIYFWFGLVSFEIVISFFYTMDEDGHVRSTFDNEYQTTWKVISMFLIIGGLYYLGENFLHQPIVNYLNTLQNTLYPLAILSVSFVAFYSTKIMLGRKWGHPVTITTLVVTALSFVISLYMFFNGNKLF